MNTATQKAKKKLALALDITGMSMNALSKQIGVADTTLSRLMKLDNPPEPRASTIERIDAAVTDYVASGQATERQLYLFNLEYTPLISPSGDQNPTSSTGNADHTVTTITGEPFVGKKQNAREILAGFVANRAQHPTPPVEHRTDIPVYGTAAGSLVGSMQVEEGRQISYVERPRGLRSSARAYALIVTGSSMSPQFKEGDLVFVDPDRKINAGDTIIIQTQNFNKEYDEPTRAYIKTFRGIMDNVLYTEQLNPPAKLDFPMKGKQEGAELVYSYDRVLTTRELFDV
nr:S24 family peptidase [uncultured Cohaesibacter sp.]